MSLTLVEAAKRHSGDVVRSAIIEIYAREVDILRVLPFDNIEGNAVKYNREEALPGVGFRGVNEGFTESTGVINPLVEPLVIAGGDCDVDRFIVKTMGMDQRTSQEAMKIKALAQAIGQKFIKGSTSTDPKEFDGLQTRLNGSQVIDAGASSGGDALSLLKLDEAIDAVDGPTHLLMSKAMKRLLTSAARSTSIGGFIVYDKDEFGRPIAMYNGMPILIADENGNGSPALGFDEANPGGGSNVGTSIYVLSLRDGMLTGIQNGDIDARDLGELEDLPKFRTRVEWYMGLTAWHPRCASRLRGIKNAAVVA